MAHMVDRMMYAGAVPWHGLGIPLPEQCDAETVRRLVFDWRADERAVFFDTNGNGGPVEERRTDAYKALIRSDNGALLCIMPESYGVVQFGETLDVLDAAAQEGTAKFITAGTLDKGRRAWALASIPSASFDVAGSEVKPYLLMSTSHDGSLAVRYHFTATYVVCNNTLTGALLDAGVKVGGRAVTKHIPNVITLKHTSGIKGRLDVARARGLVERARTYFGAFSETALRLVNERFSGEGMTDLARALFPITEEQEARRKKYGEESSSHKAQRKVRSLFDGEQIAARNAPGTKWSAFNAVTEYVDHHQHRRGPDAASLAESRFGAIMFGSAARVRDQALQLLVAA